MGKALNLNDLINTDQRNPFQDLKLSYSRLSDFDRNGPRALVEKQVVDNQGVKIGSLVDILLFDSDQIHKLYHISDFQEPSATLGTLCNIILQDYESIPSEEEIFNIIERNGFWKATKKYETIKANFDVPHFWGYLEDKFKSKDKIVISSTDYDKALSIVDSLLTHKFMRDFWSKEDVTRFYQVKFETYIEGILFRGIIDIVEIDNVKKTIRFIDLKTTGNNASEFVSSFIKYRYYLQSAIYQQAFKDVLKELSLDSDYTLLSFNFIVIGTKEMIPVTFDVTDNWNLCSYLGFKTTGGYLYKGLYQLIQDVKYHYLNDEYSLSRELSENNGLLEIDDSFINLLNAENIEL